jgi:TatD DNase family protein
MFIDTHVHLNNKDLYAKIDEVISEAKNVGVNKFFVVGYDYESSQLAIEMAKKNKNCFAIIGFHPTEIKNYTDKEYEWLYENAKEDVVVAIGEIGYDFHWDTTTKEEQYYAFVRQIEIAKKALEKLKRIGKKEDKIIACLERLGFSNRVIRDIV